VTRAATRAPTQRERWPGTPWLLLLVLLAGLTASLVVDALLAAGTAGDRRPGPPVFGAGPPAGPLVDLAGTPVRWARGDGQGVGIALVDPGLEPDDLVERSAEVAAVLDRHGAGGSWFLRGHSVQAHPELARTARAHGGELGVTGYTGRDLAALPAWRVRVELATTQAVLAARTGRSASLLLLPSSAGPESLDAAAYDTGRTAARLGYGLVVGVPAEEAAAGQVALVELGPGAADRLEALLTRVRASGLEPRPVARLAGVAGDVDAPASTASRFHGELIVAAVTAAGVVGTVVAALFWPVTLLLALRAVAGTVAAVRHARSPRSGDWVGPVTVIVPAYNEAAGIAATVRSLVASEWPWGLEVIVVDDGSTDGTAEVVRDLRLPGVWVIDQPNAGKPGALNTAIAAARTEVVVLVDGDTVFRPDTVDRLVAPFDDPRVGAVSGNAKVRNRRSLLGRWQHIEYVMGFNLDRRLLALCQAIPTVPGAVGAFRLDVLRQVGGVSHDTLAEDTDLTVAVARRGWRVVYRDDAIAWTEAPFTVGDLWRQRYRWSYGTLQAVWKHRAALRERRGIGLVGLPYAAVFQVALPVVAPVADVAALVALATAGVGGVVVAWLAFTFVQLVLAVTAFRLDRERLGPLWALPLQQVFYRQLMYLVVIRSVLTATSGTRLRWQKLRRLDDVRPATAG
jgi:cellulose synthase/poly-beta-1,6-N-acetylglucosamine synthase-like glycosyltransferase